MNFQTGTRAGVHAREEPAQRRQAAPDPGPGRPDPLAELRDDLDVVLRVLAATSPVALVMLGRRKANRFSHAIEAAQREVRRALEATGAGPA